MPDLVLILDDSEGLNFKKQEDLIKRIFKIDKLDTELQHSECDEILLEALTELGFENLVDAYRKLQDSGNWHYA